MNIIETLQISSDNKLKYGLVCSLLLGLLLVYFNKLVNQNKTGDNKVKNSNNNNKKLEIKQWTVEPVDSSFHWQSATPLKSFPFKDADYKLTMGIKNLQPQDWLLIENSYKQVLQIKDKIIHNQHPDYPGIDMRNNTVFKTDEAKPAIIEFYNLVIDYMIKKYPMHFKINHNNGDNEENNDDESVYNNIIDKTFPIKVDSSYDSDTILDFLSQTIEEDFIILLKDPSRIDEKDGDEYFFKAGIFAFAAGFNPRDRFNTPLSFIHHPIPGYESKLKLSMNRFFNRIQPGQFVTRSNFSVQTHNKYYVDDSNKGHNLPAGFEQKPLNRHDLDFDNQVHYRSERQTLTKLPNSGAIIFTIRTYLLPMSKIKQESAQVKQNFIGAINRFPDDIKLYKRAAEWAPPVTEYLQDNDI